MKRRHLITVFLLLVSVSMSAVSTLDSLLCVLENEIAQSSVYIERKQDFIRSLCACRPMTPELQLRIAREYQHFQSDSSRVWYLKVLDGEGPIHTEAFIGFMQLLASTGHYDNAIAMLHSESAPAFCSSEGFKRVWLLYEEMVPFAQIPALQEEYRATAKLYYDSMMVALEAEKEVSEESAPGMRPIGHRRRTTGKRRYVITRLYSIV